MIRRRYDGRKAVHQCLGSQTMWSARLESLNDGRTLRYAIERDSKSISFAEALQAWLGDATFRTALNDWLADAPFSAFRWETPPIKAKTVDRPFEFVLVDSPALDRAPQPKAFAEHFAKATNEGVVEFSNLGRDAVMIVPCPLGPANAYGHLAAFVRQAPGAQRQALWKHTAEAMSRRLSAKPVWLSTAGAGVAWLHVRLDDRPKYYGHAPYRSAC